ncbi:hypothetical protein PAPYR_4697 [Paratrimastix pyriformis]|uniref:Uncharacterized protein n=1 Tax=Paratrimastix pyriformis TaxID=342808 RepID=A0ABQ8UN13_9EUKA|nr:hypothetical protein PAPYR_4697 [Paratrimastix pyriformis]
MGLVDEQSTSTDAVIFGNALNFVMGVSATSLHSWARLLAPSLGMTYDQLLLVVFQLMKSLLISKTFLFVLTRRSAPVMSTLAAHRMHNPKADLPPGWERLHSEHHQFIRFPLGVHLRAEATSTQGNLHLRRLYPLLPQPTLWDLLRERFPGQWPETPTSSIPVRPPLVTPPPPPPCGYPPIDRSPPPPLSPPTGCRKAPRDTATPPERPPRTGLRTPRSSMSPPALRLRNTTPNTPTTQSSFTARSLWCSPPPPTGELCHTPREADCRSITQGSTLLGLISQTPVSRVTRPGHQPLTSSVS